ncbi:MAG: hypothetical protein ISR65_04205 [Bacteriovoracaceae bacterium]|nr:hypothetical protein [Bacteriovoracaceae bacterium]
MRLLLLACILSLSAQVSFSEENKINELYGQYKLTSGTRTCFQEIAINEDKECLKLQKLNVESDDIQVEQFCHINKGLQSEQATEEDNNFKKITTYNYKSELFNFNILNVTHRVAVRNAYGFLLKNTVVNKVFSLSNNKLEYMVTKSDTAVFEFPEYEMILCSYEKLEE